MTDLSDPHASQSGPAAADDLFDASAAVRTAHTLYPTRTAITAEPLHSQSRAILAGIDRR